MGATKNARKRRLRRPRGMGKAEWAGWSDQDKRDIVKRRKSRFKRHINLFNTLTTLLSITLLMLSGCMIAEGEKTTYLPTGEVVSHVKVKMTQCMTDSSRTNFKVKIPDLGDVELGSSIMSPEKFKELLAELKPFLITLMGL